MFGLDWRVIAGLGGGFVALLSTLSALSAKAHMTALDSHFNGR